MNPLRPLAIWIGGRAWLPGYAKHIVAFDMMLRRVSRGRVRLLALGSLPEMLLTVAGRRGGIERTTPPLCVPVDRAGERRVGKEGRSRWWPAH